ncbi:hypothetical protein [Shimia sp. R9_3]|uniref:hypothetical protein n=1 Tax=Shimia sp. R9_3 TaxID=2821113 RepID=UPI001ADBF8AC|nr:hypothetical protein [Shimia sp. R9_3]MBO9400765.1 hypothetical protein [Shimia sp. R9_3]
MTDVSFGAYRDDRLTNTQLLVTERLGMKEHKKQTAIEIEAETSLGASYQGAVVANIDAPYDIGISDRAHGRWAELPDSVRADIQEGLVGAWAKITKFLVLATSQTYLSREQVFQLNYLTNTYQTVMAAGYPIRVKICEISFSWTIVSIGDPESADAFDIVKLL